MGVGNDEAFTITGPATDGNVATLSHANPFTVAPVVELNDADFTATQVLVHLCTPAIDNEHSVILNRWELQYLDEEKKILCV